MRCFILIFFTVEPAIIPTKTGCAGMTFFAKSPLKKFFGKYSLWKRALISTCMLFMILLFKGLGGKNMFLLLWVPMQRLRVPKRRVFAGVRVPQRLSNTVVYKA